jgi:hypothetical protein
MVVQVFLVLHPALWLITVAVAAAEHAVGMERPVLAVLVAVVPVVLRLRVLVERLILAVAVEVVAIMVHSGLADLVDLALLLFLIPLGPYRQLVVLCR